MFLFYPIHIQIYKQQYSKLNRSILEQAWMFTSQMWTFTLPKSTVLVRSLIKKAMDYKKKKKNCLSLLWIKCFIHLSNFWNIAIGMCSFSHEIISEVGCCCQTRGIRSQLFQWCWGHDKCRPLQFFHNNLKTRFYKLCYVWRGTVMLELSQGKS